MISLNNPVVKATVAAVSGVAVVGLGYAGYNWVFGAKKTPTRKRNRNKPAKTKVKAA